LVSYNSLLLTNHKSTGPLAERELLRDEYGAGAYYNFAMTPWMKLTPDIQFIRPGQKDKLVSTSPPVKDGIDAATVIGLRLRMVF